MRKIRNTTTGKIHAAELCMMGTGRDFRTKCKRDLSTLGGHYQEIQHTIITCKQCKAALTDEEDERIEIGMAEKGEDAETGFLLRIQENVEVSRVPIVHDVFVKTDDLERAITKGCDRVKAMRGDVLSVRKIAVIQEYERVETIHFEPVE